MKRKVYIAGKITGDPNYREKFQWAGNHFRECGDIVLNPASLPEGMSRADYMRICFAMMESADIVAVLPNYQDSLGARVEIAWCDYIKKPYFVMPNVFGGERHD